MKAITIPLFISLIFLFRANALFAQPIAPWTATLGGSGLDQAYDAEPTSDGGVIITGGTRSNDGDVTGFHQGQFSLEDYWMAKVDAYGRLQWENCFGNDAYDFAFSTQQTTNGGYVVTGVGAGWNVRKLDTAGALQWDSTYGGEGYIPYSIQQINTGGYILAGEKHFAAPPDTIITDHKSTEFCVMKLDASGTFLWEKFYGGSNAETAYSIDQTSDNGFVVAGSTASSDGNVTGYHGSTGTDAWVIKINSKGKLIWQKTIGGTKSDQANWIRQTTDGGYIVACQTNSTDGDAVGNHGNYDFLVVKLNSGGNIVWKKLLGGTGTDKANSVCQTPDGGYMVVGETQSHDGDVSDNHGQSDYWIVKLDGTGNLLWQKSFGGSGVDIARSISTAPDGKVIVAGQAGSNDGDVVGNHGMDDYWILKFIDGNQIFYQDADGDTYGNPAVSFTGFFPPSGYVYNNLDCNDANASVHPGILPDVCNGLDDDCDGMTDEDATYVRYFKDADGDGYGNKDSLRLTCSTIAGYVTDSTDCNDGNASIHPGACEIYFNGVDEDCSGVADDCNAPSSGFSATKILATSAKVNWHTLLCAVGYTVQYRAGGTTTWIKASVSDNTGSKKLSNLQPQTTYEWQVRTKCHAAPNVFSGYSAIQNFTTASTRNQETDITETGFPVSVYPNPCSDFITVDCNYPKGNATIKIYSIIGDVVMQKFVPSENNPVHENLDVSKLPPGTYIIEVENNFEKTRIKFVKE